MTTPLRDVAATVELGRRVIWGLMTLADYHIERERERRWRYQGLSLPKKWELGVDPRPKRGPTYTVKTVSHFPIDFSEKQTW